MNDPLVTAAQHLYTAFQEDPNRANLIHLISDGRANIGVTNADDINTNFRNAQGNAPIVMNTFSVGRYANNGLLSKLTVFNTGRLHYISDATVRDVGLNDELTRVFDDYKCPILSNVTFNYPDGSVDQLTITSFPYFFKGQELAVSGRILSEEDDYIHMTITGVTGSGRTVTWRRIISMRLASQSEEECLVDKMSAYMRVKQNYTDYLYRPTEELKDYIIEQSKQNHFVTNLTSLLVSEQIGQTCTCPDECICNTQCPISGALPGDNVAGNSLSPGRPGGSPGPYGPPGGRPGSSPYGPPGGSPGPYGPPGGSPGPYGRPGGSPGPYGPPGGRPGSSPYGPPGGSPGCDTSNGYGQPGYPSGPDGCSGQKGSTGPRDNYGRYRRRKSIFPQINNSELKLISVKSHEGK